MPLVGAFTSPGQFSVQFDTFNPDTRSVFSFCRTANRLNVAHILSQTEIDSIDAKTGIGEINVGEYVFDAVAVTDQIEAINTELTEQELAAISGNESESDRAFRKLFEQPIPDSRNRLIGVKPNTIGIQYRLDNGGPKSITALETNGIGSFVGEGAADYRDGTSKILLVNLTKITDRLPQSPDAPKPPPGSLQAEARKPKVGDVVYLTYVAVREHYIRYSINVKWSITGISLPPQCFGIPLEVKVAAYRFYEWSVDSEIIAGWRVVETNNIPVNFVAPLGVPGKAVLGDFILGGGSGIQTVPFMPANSTIEQITSFIDNQSLLPTYQVNLNQPAGDANYQINPGSQGSTQAYLRAPWFLRGNYTTYQNWSEAQSTVWFNVHAEALKKRDVDKFGIERFLASEIEQDIKSNALTFFPFMDDAGVDNPNFSSNKFLDSSNTKFAPIQPISRWTTANAEIDCATGGGVALFPNGDGFNGTGDVFAVFGIASPVITEFFDLDTRLLVEIFATAGAASGPDTIAIEGADGGAVPAVSCIADRIKQTAFLCHSDQDSFLLFNTFDYGQLSDGLRKMRYRPDFEVNLENPTPGIFQRHLGYSGLLGDVPGFKPGQIIGVSKYSDLSKFRFKTTDVDAILNQLPNIPESNVEPIVISKDNGKAVIPINISFNGSTEIIYKLSGTNNVDLLILFKTGIEITGSIDSITISPQNNKLVINHAWMRGDTMEIIGDLSNLEIDNVSVLQLDNTISNDFLNEQLSSTESDREQFDNLKLYTKSVLFQSQTMSIGQDKDGRIYIFFNDQDSGISCLQSNDDGLTWTYHYGVIESINGISSEHPFVVPSYQQNKIFIFYRFNGKILCKSIPTTMFLFKDAFLIERFEKDRFVIGDSNNISTEKVSLFTNEGESLRRKILSYAAAGDLTESDFLLLVGIDSEKSVYQPNEDRNIETRQTDGSIVTTVQSVIKNPIAIGNSTAFTNKNIDNSFFSVYRENNGLMRLFFLNQAKDEVGGGKQLQCNFSTDDGINWYDAWEWIEHEYSRFRHDSKQLTSFIDRNATEVTNNIEQTNPNNSEELASFGVNVHWSRLKRHKINPDNGLNSDSQVLDIDGVYVFYHNFLHQVFLFYVYNNCLLCKVFDDSTFDIKVISQGLNGLKGMASVKKTIEQDIRAFFIDGNLSTSDIREELHYYINQETKERQIEGNIIFTQQYGINRFNDTRNIIPQRVNAYKFGNCNVRVFYKINRELKAATWNGSEWFVEEFLREEFDDVSSLVPSLEGIKDVVGGFGGTGFEV